MHGDLRLCSCYPTHHWKAGSLVHISTLTAASGLHYRPNFVSNGFQTCSNQSKVKLTTAYIAAVTHTLESKRHHWR